MCELDPYSVSHCQLKGKYIFIYLCFQLERRHYNSIQVFTVIRCHTDVQHDETFQDWLFTWKRVGKFEFEIEFELNLD